MWTAELDNKRLKPAWRLNDNAQIEIAVEPDKTVKVLLVL